MPDGPSTAGTAFGVPKVSTVEEVAQAVVALRDLLDERDRNYAQQFAAAEKNVKIALESASNAVNAAMNATDKAVIKAEGATEKRFDAVNEFRATLADQQTTFARKDTVESAINKLSEITIARFATIDMRISDLIAYQNRQEGQLSGVSAVWAIFIGIAGIAVGALVAYFKGGG